MHREAALLLLAGALASCDKAGPYEPLAMPAALAVASAGGLLLQENTRLPLDQTVADPCTGENVRLTGELHLAHKVSTDGLGVQHDAFHTNFTNVTGVGLSSGDFYRGTSAETAQSSFWVLQSPPRDFKTTHEFTLHLIADSGSNFMLHGIAIVSRTDGVFDFKVVSTETSCHGGV